MTQLTHEVPEPRIEPTTQLTTAARGESINTTPPMLHCVVELIEQNEIELTLASLVIRHEPVSWVTLTIISTKIVLTVMSTSTPIWCLGTFVDI
jgi:hypothetical protein